MSKIGILAKCGFAAVLAVAGGCFSVPYGDPGPESAIKLSSESEYSVLSVKGIEPIVTVEPDGNGGASISVGAIRIHGSFSVKTTERWEKSKEGGAALAAGFFPGVLSCDNPLDRAAVNGLVAFWFNIVYLGLPTVSGLLFEPFNGKPLDHASGMCSAGSFRRSALIGFAKYREKPSVRTDTSVTTAKLQSMDITEGTVAFPQKGGTAVSLGSGEKVFFSREELESSERIVNMDFTISALHPLKGKIDDYEQMQLSVAVPKEK